MTTPQVGDKVIAFDHEAWKELSDRTITAANAYKFWKYARIANIYVTKKAPSFLQCAVIFEEKGKEPRISYNHPIGWVQVVEAGKR